MRIPTRKAFLISLAFLLFVIVIAPSCRKRSETSKTGGEPLDFAPSPQEVAPFERDWETIRASGNLIVLAANNSTTYFLHQGEPLGYEYELLQAFAKEQNLALKVVVVKDRKQIFPLLNSGEGDVAAARLIPAPENEGRASFTRALYRTEPALVQQAESPEKAKDAMPAEAAKVLDPGPADGLPAIDVQARLVSRPGQLGGQRVDLPEQHPYKRTLFELADQISGDIEVVEWNGEIGDEALAQKVARGEVEFTVMQSNLAELKEAEFTNLKVRPVLGQQHKVAWAVRKNSPALLEVLNRWIEEKQQSPLFNTLYRKYFIDRQSHIERVKSEYLTSQTGKLCRFDPLLKQYSNDLQWDWRLLASQAFQESRFKPDARSWAGATGLLQLMPRTAREFGVQNAQDPEDNVRGAVKFLQWLTKHWSSRIPDEGERLKFILASYNCGQGHVEDAQRLTRKYGGDPQVWRDVSYWLLQKSKQQYYADPEVKYGFCRGIEPVTYVSLILERFDHYKQFVVN
ncbi:MAG TPA: transglycosylase SLT domain-containing protein [Pyrinomonadaceae bacterium]|jgi:membrane-bound lytic murein transglycosylase F|nr:transglycosylase SLT domain-containing protein [Pyrinomonadaceae bacterium]